MPCPIVCAPATVLENARQLADRTAEKRANDAVSAALASSEVKVAAPHAVLLLSISLLTNKFSACGAWGAASRALLDEVVRAAPWRDEPALARGHAQS